MNYVFLIVVYVLMGAISACGIRGNPVSPSEGALNTSKNQSLFPLNNETDINDSDNINGDKTETALPYVPTGVLLQSGNDYNANFGVENDDLDAVFERIRPQSSIRKRRNIIPLGTGR
jgi:hypothetical protein